MRKTLDPKNVSFASPYSAQVSPIFNSTNINPDVQSILEEIKDAVGFPPVITYVTYDNICIARWFCQDHDLRFSIKVDGAFSWYFICSEVRYEGSSSGGLNSELNTHFRTIALANLMSE